MATWQEADRVRRTVAELEDSAREIGKVVKFITPVPRSICASQFAFDRMASRGVIADGMTPADVTSTPISHATIYTGAWPAVHGVRVGLALSVSITWVSSIVGAFTLPRFSGGCTHAQFFFNCSSEPVTATTISGVATMALVQ